MGAFLYCPYNLGQFKWLGGIFHIKLDSGA